MRKTSDTVLGSYGLQARITSATALLLCPAFSCTSHPESSLSLSDEGARKQGWTYQRLASSIRDLDRDGLNDYAMVGLGGTLEGSVVVVSARTRRALYVLHGNPAVDKLGYAMVGLGDINGDGIPDLAVSSDGANEWLTVGSGDTQKSGPSFVRVVNGRDGTTLYQVDDWSKMECLGDIDGDGVGDLLFASTEERRNDVGRVAVASGRTGTILKHLTPPGDCAWRHFGFVLEARDEAFVVGTRDAKEHGDVTMLLYRARDQSIRAHKVFLSSLYGEVSVVRWLADVDRDGVCDLAVATSSGHVVLLSGATLDILTSRSLSGMLMNGPIAPILEVIGDSDQDSIDDFVVGQVVTKDGVSISSLEILSGRTCETLLKADGWCGECCGVCSCGDVDGDGLADLIMTYLSGGSKSYQVVRCISARLGTTLWEERIDEIVSH